MIKSINYGVDIIISFKFYCIYKVKKQKTKKKKTKMKYYDDDDDAN